MWQSIDLIHKLHKQRIGTISDQERGPVGAYLWLFQHLFFEQYHSLDVLLLIFAACYNPAVSRQISETSRSQEIPWDEDVQFTRAKERFTSFTFQSHSSPHWYARVCKAFQLLYCQDQQVVYTAIERYQVDIAIELDYRHVEECSLIHLISAASRCCHAMSWSDNEVEWCTG